jgi:uncharacterized membrane protein
MTTSSDESLLAAASHFFGFLAALVIWIVHKEKSRFVRFQATQAMAFGLFESAILFLVGSSTVMASLIVLVIGIGDIAIFGSQNNPTSDVARSLVALMGVVPLLLACVVLPIIGFLFIARIIATIRTFQGKNFHYPLLGDLIEQQLKNV